MRGPSGGNRTQVMNRAQEVGCSSLATQSALAVYRRRCALCADS